MNKVPDYNGWDSKTLFKILQMIWKDMKRLRAQIMRVPPCCFHAMKVLHSFETPFNRLSEHVDFTIFLTLSRGYIGQVSGRAEQLRQFTNITFICKEYFMRAHSLYQMQTSYGQIMNWSLERSCNPNNTRILERNHQLKLQGVKLVFCRPIVPSRIPRTIYSNRSNVHWPKYTKLWSTRSAWPRVLRWKWKLQIGHKSAV